MIDWPKWNVAYAYLSTGRRVEWGNIVCIHSNNFSSFNTVGAF